MQDNLSKKLREELTRTSKIASYTDFEIEQAVEKYRSLNSPVSPTTSEARVELPELPETESNLNLLSSFQAITQLSEDHQRGLRNLHQGNEKFEGN